MSGKGGPLPWFRLRRVRMHLVLLTGLLLAPATVPSRAEAQAAIGDGTGGLVGQVTDANGEPLTGVLVAAAEQALTTGAEGRFEFDSLADGFHDVHLLHPEHGMDWVKVAVGAGLITRLTIEYRADGRPAVRVTGVTVGTLASAAHGEEGDPGGKSSTSRIVGRVLDRTTNRPVASAQVWLSGAGRRTTTSDRGRFTLHSVPGGTQTLRIRHLGYGQREAEVRVPARRTVEVEVELAPEPVEVEPLKVAVDVRSPRLERAGYYDRKRMASMAGFGHFLDGEALRGRGGKVSQILSSVSTLNASGQTTVYLPGEEETQLVEGLVYFPRHRQLRLGQCFPAVYLDGHKVIGSGDAASYVARLGPRGLNSLVLPSEVAGIEVYNGAAGTVGEFQASDSRCGVVVIWTR